MRQVEKLVQQIREALAEPGDLVAMQLLASQYAQHCQDANRRLGQCADMIGRGNKYHTLQLAETKPSLLDLVSLLSFGNHQEWRTLCKERNLPVPEKIDEKGVRLLNELYATGLPATEELWREFRTAIPEGDDRKALSIVRAILNRDGTDADARREVPRLEKKIVRAKLVELEGSVERRDGAEVVRIMSEIEAVTPETPAEGGVWTGAVEVRRLYFKANAEAECEALLGQVKKLHEAGEWRPAVTLLAQVQSLCAEHGITLHSASERIFSGTQAWAAKLQSEHARDLAWQKALSALEEQVQVVADKEVGERKRPLSELREDRMLITKRWNEVEEFRREVPSETVNRVRRALADVKAHSTRIERQRKVLLVAASLVMLAGTAVGGIFSVRYWRAREFARELGDVTSARKLLPVEKFLDELRARHASILGNATLSARINEAEAWIADQKAREANLTETVSQLRAAHLETGFGKAAPETIQQQLVQTRELLLPIAEDLRAPAESGLLEIENKFGEFLAGNRTVLLQRFREAMERAESTASSGLEFTKQPGEVRAVLSQVMPLATELDRLGNPSLDALKPPDSELAKLDLLRNRLKKFQDEIQKLDIVEQACAKATTLAMYLKALDGYSDTAFLQSLEPRSAKLIRETVKDGDAIAAALLMPGDPVGWLHFKANVGRNALYPDDVTPLEKGIFLGLRDNDNLRGIYRYEYADPMNNVGRPYIYAQVPLARHEALVGDRKNVKMTGHVYLPWKSRAAVNFAPENFSAVLIGKGRIGALPDKEQVAPESQFFSRLNLPSLVNDVVSHYQRPMLSFLDNVITGQVDPLFKGYVHSQLMELADKRPYDWGLQWTTAREHKRRLDEIVAPALGKGDWMTPKRQNDLEKALTDFYSGIKGVSYAKQAAVLSQLVEKANASPLIYAGYVKMEGALYLVGGGLDVAELWGFKKDNLQPALLFRRKPGSAEFDKVAEPLPMTPLFFCKLDRQKTLDEACKAADIAPGHPSIAGRVPPFFAQP